MQMTSLYTFGLFAIIVGGGYLLTRGDVDKNKSLTKKGFIKSITYYIVIFLLMVLFVFLTNKL